MKRQKIRKLLLFISLLLFPVTLYYFSPVLIIQGALDGIITGSFITFILMTLLSIFFGRAFCAYICPVGGIGEASFAFNDKRARPDRRRYIKYVIWIVWVISITICFFIHGGIEKADFLYMTDHGISVSDLHSLIIYYFIICIVLIPNLIFGKRAVCHYLCWMAPFMVIGTKIRNLLHLPGLHITADRHRCVTCGQCNRNCPMSLDVSDMVQNGRLHNSECILCGACIDNCPKKVLKYRFKADKNDER